MNIPKAMYFQTGLKCPTDDGFLLRFLRARKFDYDRAYEMLLNYYTIRAEHREYFDNLVPSTVKNVLDAGVSMILPKPDKHGRRIVYFRPGQSKIGFKAIKRLNLL